MTTDPRTMAATAIEAEAADLRAAFWSATITNDGMRRLGELEMELVRRRVPARSGAAKPADPRLVRLALAAHKKLLLPRSGAGRQARWQRIVREWFYDRVDRLGLARPEADDAWTDLTTRSPE